VLVACSGGPDSVALAAATAFEAPSLGIEAGLVTIDHALQPGSAERAATVADLGAKLGLTPVLTRRVEVGAGGGPEAAARTARYAALAAAADEAGAAAVLLGHTLDDQAETVLLGLGRGSGPRSIAGMRAVDPPWLRPLLGVRRATTAAACAAESLGTWADPHNAEPRFTRSRLRHEVLPLLEDVLAGGVAGALARTADLLRDDLDALDADAARVAAALSGPCAGCAAGRAGPAPLDGRTVPAGRASPPAAAPPAGSPVGPPAAGPEPGPRAAAESAGDRTLDAVVLAAYPPAIRTRVLRGWLRDGGVTGPTSAQLVALDAMVAAWHGQGAVALPGGLAAFRRHGRLHLGRPAR